MNSAGQTRFLTTAGFNFAQLLVEGRTFRGASRSQSRFRPLRSNTVLLSLIHGSRSQPDWHEYRRGHSNGSQKPLKNELLSSMNHVLTQIVRSAAREIA